MIGCEKPGTPTRAGIRGTGLSRPHRSFQFEFTLHFCTCAGSAEAQPVAASALNQAALSAHIRTHRRCARGMRAAVSLKRRRDMGPCMGLGMEVPARGRTPHPYISLATTRNPRTPPNWRVSTGRPAQTGAFQLATAV